MTVTLGDSINRWTAKPNFARVVEVLEGKTAVAQAFRAAAGDRNRRSSRRTPAAERYGKTRHSDPEGAAYPPPAPRQHPERAIGDGISFDNHRRPHPALDMSTRAEASALAA